MTPSSPDHANSDRLVSEGAFSVDAWEPDGVDIDGAEYEIDRDRARER